MQKSQTQGTAYTKTSNLGYGLCKQYSNLGNENIKLRMLFIRKPQTEAGHTVFFVFYGSCAKHAVTLTAPHIGSHRQYN